MKFGTKVIHAGVEPDPTTGAIMTPIYQTSTYVQASPGDHQGYEYARTQNPTRHTLENNLAALENGTHARCFASGMAAVDAVIKLLKPGDEVISTNDLYGGSYRIFTKIFANYGIKFHFVPMNNLESVKEKITDKTRMFWVETPTNPMMNVVDIQAVASLAKDHSAWTVVDNTFATPYLQNPLDLGADMVLHSITKYLGGHSDTVMGAVIVNDSTLDERLGFIQNSCGAVPGPQDCFLVLRGIKTLHVRMQRHCENGQKIAEYLNEHAKVERIYYPGLETSANYEVARKQMRDFGGMLSFVLKGDRMEDAFRTLEKLKVFALAESLGGVESLAGHPASMTHASIPKEERAKTGLSDSLIRLSVGIEDSADLIADLEQAIG
ncbi:MAG: cystathionine gamma-synthase [Tunicatimonas sp.]|uniref:cystathionine gamma-synthase n=1 Tax=Tunicatimonas sp. TaxID=1940096 RepID=UPI003C729012